MSNDQLYNAIFKRKSIRKYDMNRLADSTMNKLQDYLLTMKPLIKEIQYELSFLLNDEVKNILPVRAPHYICLYSKKQDGYLLNAGFLLQQIDLYLSVNNIGSCWLGMARPTEKKQKMNGLKFVIMLAFGNSAEPIHRTDPAQYNRKSLTEITDIHGPKEFLEPVRLSPSASNTQPWFFSGSADEIVVFRRKHNALKELVYGNLNQIDIGIALCHLWLSLDHQGKTADFDFRGEASDGYEFMAKVKERMKREFQTNKGFIHNALTIGSIILILNGKYK